MSLILPKFAKQKVQLQDEMMLSVITFTLKTLEHSKISVTLIFIIEIL